MKTLLEIFNDSHNNSYNAGWWQDPVTGVDMSDPNFEYFNYVIATKIALIHSEVSEALEGFRADKMDDKLPHRKMLEVELADAIIRIGDLAKCLNLDVEGAIEEKFRVNRTRSDHAIANRRKAGGKKF